MTTAERRDTILNAAARLFEHYGHQKTTMADVAREAGVGIGSLYLEFPSKEAIVRELSLATHVGVLSAMRAATLRDGDHAARLTAALVARTRCFLDLRQKGQHACELVHCPTEGVQSAHKRFYEDEHALLQQILEAGRDDGSFDAADCSSMAALIQRAFSSLSPPFIFGPKDEDALAASLGLCELVLNGLLSRATRSKASGGRRKV
jgi:AcrR family transcriptional regulator